MWQCSQSLSSLECRPGIRSSFDYVKKREGEEEVAEHGATLLDIMKAARKCICEFVMENIVVMYNKIENVLHRLTAQAKISTETYWLKKY
jgi:hypothetical protein